MGVVCDVEDAPGQYDRWVPDHSVRYEQPAPVHARPVEVHEPDQHSPVHHVMEEVCEEPVVCVQKPVVRQPVCLPPPTYTSRVVPSYCPRPPPVHQPLMRSYQPQQVCYQPSIKHSFMQPYQTRLPAPCYNPAQVVHHSPVVNHSSFVRGPVHSSFGYSNVHSSFAHQPVVTTTQAPVLHAPVHAPAPVVHQQPVQHCDYTTTMNTQAILQRNQQLRESLGLPPAHGMD